MRIDAGTSFPYAARHAPATLTGPSAASIAIRSDGGRQIDFTSMTRQEMRDWVNAQIRSGEMSLDESRPFMAMTMKIPVGGGSVGELAAEGDGTRYDFAQKLRDGIQGALSRNDETSLKMLESALQIVQRYQGRTVGVDVRV